MSVFIVSLVAALLVLRAGTTERAELPDGGSAIELVFSDDATVSPPSADIQPALVVVGVTVGDYPDTRPGRPFVSEIFRPPITPLARAS